MNRIVLAAVGVVALGAAHALAADLPRAYTKAPPLAPIYDWSGFYIGGNAGGGWAHDCRDNLSTGAGLGCYSAGGAIGGGQLGYRWQQANWVFGLEGQGDVANISAGTQNLANALNNINTRIDALGLITGQVGYAWNSVLWYVKGGAGVVDQRFDFTSSATGVVTSSTGYQSHWGGAVGTGVEVGLSRDWSVGLEYDHIFSGRRNVSFTNIVPLADAYRSGGDVDLVAVRINYHFGAPIIARF
ncbi:outer membrane beta-barrel protein [Bradyrhizobium sp. NP1]|uniref:outer membrane protein n=1 Tax=Bradyrhizobium sp. NP1 TaxID=3049772 RepID=UPI0025A5FBAA|nr:outer membrane beta-barrel protein [Bradyrhizobium sp. NP1]WJR81635.1 outer membrane beta-barrel protein [Bradyrhizobium sp. NP1]